MEYSRLIFADKLLGPFYFFLKWLKCLLPRKSSACEGYYVIKFFGLGSITRIAYFLDNSEIDKDKVTFITLKNNQDLIDQFGLKAVYIRSNNGFYFVSDCLKTILATWKQKGVHILDMERSSNFSGIFRILLAIRKSSAGFYFKAESRMIGNQLFVSLVDKPALDSIAEIFGDHLNIEVKTIENRTITKQIIVNINAGSYLPQRMFPISNYRDLVLKLHQNQPEWTFLVTGAASELDRVNQFIGALEQAGIDSTKVRNLAGKQNLKEFLEAIKMADLVITNDSGPIHFANYLGSKTVGIWGPTSALIVGYPNSNNMLNLSPTTACSPCFIHPKSKVAKACGGALTCFKDYNIAKMAAKIEAFMASSPKKTTFDQV